MPTRAELAKLLRQQYPDLSSQYSDDGRLVEAWSSTNKDWVSQHPEYQVSDQPSTSSGLIPLGLRVIPATLTPMGGVPGALGAGAGEVAGQLYEYLTEGTKPRLGELAAQTAIGAIPFSGPAKGLTRARAIMGQAAKGAGLGAVSTGLTSLGKGETPSVGDVATGAGIGTILGGISQGLWGPKRMPLPEPTAKIPGLDALAESRMVKRIPAEGFIERQKEKYVDELTKAKHFLEEEGTAVGKPGESAVQRMEIKLGGAAGRAQLGREDMEDIIDKAGPLLPDVTQYLDLFGMHEGLSRLMSEASDLIAAGKNAQAQHILDKVFKGRAMPEGYTPQKLLNDFQLYRNAIGPQRLAQVDAIAQRVFDYNRQTLDILKDADIVSDAAYNALNARASQGHIPLVRILDDFVSGVMKSSKMAPTLAAQKSIKKLGGSARTTQDPFTASLVRRQIAEFEAGRNGAARAFVDFFDKHPTLSKVVFRTKGGIVPEGYDVVSAFENGHPQEWAVPETIAHSLKLMNQDDASLLQHGLLGFFSNLTQGLATTFNTGFAITNPFRDVVEKFVVAKEIKNPVDMAKYLGTWVQTLAESIKNPRNLNRREFYERGGAYSTMQKNISARQGILGRSDTLIDRLLGPLAYASNLLEETTKIASMKDLAKRGIGGEEQVWRVRNTGGSPDFAIRGSKGKALNHLILFFNAQMQGISRNVRALKEMDPKKAAEVLAGITGLELIRDEWNSQFTDPDGVPAADRITENDKNNYWTFVMPQTGDVEGVQRHKAFKVSKGHILRLLANPISDAIEWARYGRTNLSQTGLDIISQFIPGQVNIKSGDVIGSALRGGVASLNPALRSIIEQAGNEQAFTNVPIVPKRMEGRSPALQFTSTTAPVFKKTSEALAGTPLENTWLGSPRRLEALSQAILPGSVGEGLTELGNIMTGEPKKGLVGMFTNPVQRRFSGSPGDEVKRNMERKFYAELSQSEKAAQDYNALKKTDPDKADAYFLKHQDTFDRRKSITKIARILGSLRQSPEKEAEATERYILRQAMELLGEPTKSPRQKLTKDELDSMYEVYMQQFGGR